MTGSVQTGGPPVTGGEKLKEEMGVGGEGMGNERWQEGRPSRWAVIVATLRGGSSLPATECRRRPGRHRDRPISLYNFNSRVDDFVRLVPFFFPPLARNLLAPSSARGRAQTTGARPPGLVPQGPVGGKFADVRFVEESEPTPTDRTEETVRNPIGSESFAFLGTDITEVRKKRGNVNPTHA